MRSSKPEAVTWRRPASSGVHPNYLHRLIRNLELKEILRSVAGNPRED